MSKLKSFKNFLGIRRVDITREILILIFNKFYLGRYRARKFRTGAPKGQYFSIFSSKLDVSQLPQKINFSPKKKIMNRWARKKNNGGDTALLLSSYIQTAAPKCSYISLLNVYIHSFMKFLCYMHIIWIRTHHLINDTSRLSRKRPRLNSDKADRCVKI